MSDDRVTIYIALKNEGTEVWKPVSAAEEVSGVYKILSENQDPLDEMW